MQHKIHNDAIRASLTKAQTAIAPAMQPGFIEKELGRSYAQVLHNISARRAAGIYTDSEAQRMADAVREFHGLLTDAIGAKAAQRRN